MTTMWFPAVVIFTLCLWTTQVEGQRTCTYADLCERAKQILGRDIVITLPCLQEEMCAEFFREWSDCSATCGGGTRTRFGRCCSAKCTRIISDTEACNTSACGGVGVQ